MMYVNIVCTCGAQIILSFIFSIMSEKVELLEMPNKEGSQVTWEIRKDQECVFTQECAVPF